MGDTSLAVVSEVRGWRGVRSEEVVRVAYLHLIGCGMKLRGRGEG